MKESISTYMSIYKFKTLFILLLCLFSTSVQIKANDKKLFPFEYGEVQLRDCDLKSKMDAEMEFYLNLSNDDLLKGFRVRRGISAPGRGLTGWYQADIFHVFGQLLSGYSRFYAATGDARLMEKAVYLYKEWNKTIRADGFFFYTNTPNDYHYTFDKMLCGVIDFYLYCYKDPKVLECMDKITDWAIANLDRSKPLQGFYPGEWYTLSENLYRAYLITNDQKYADFAEVWEYPEFWTPLRTNGNPFSNEPALHAYSHLNSLCGAAAAYEVNGQSEYLQVCTKGYDFFRENECLVTGGFGIDEKIINPNKIQDLLENSDNSFEVHCSCWACFKLCKQLISFTGDARFGNWVELLMINGMGANIPMTEDGKNYHYANYNPFGAYKTNHTDGWWCCTGTRIQAFADIPNLIWFHNQDDLFMNLFLPSTLTWKGMKISQETDFPKVNKTTIRFEGNSSDFAFSFRKPEWLTASPIVKLNGVTIIPDEDENWFRTQQTWENGDFLEIELPMDFVITSLPKGKSYPAALKYGPVAMAIKNAEKYPTDALTADKHRLSDDDLFFGVEGYSDWKMVPYYTIKEDERYCIYLAPDYTYRIEQKNIINQGTWNEYAGLWVSNTPGDYIQASFKGSGIRWKGFKYDDSGMVDIYIDDKYINTIDQYSAQRDSPFSWEKLDLEEGVHTIKLLLTDRKGNYSKGHWMNYKQLLYYSSGESTDLESIEAKGISYADNMLSFGDTYEGQHVSVCICDLSGRMLYKKHEEIIASKQVLLPAYNEPYLIVVYQKDGTLLFQTKILR